MLVSEQEFAATVEALRQLLESGAARLLIVPPLGGGSFDIRFEMRQDHASVKQALATHDKTFVQFRRAAEDVAQALAAAAHVISPEAFANRRSQAHPSADHEDPAVARRKLELVEKGFDLQALKRRLWLKRTSKTLTLGSLRWEVGHRLADDDVTSPQGGPVPYATLRLEAVDIVRNPLSAFSQPVQEMTLTLDHEDIAALMDALRRLESAMPQEPQGEALHE